MKIAILNEYGPAKKGGTETFLLELSEKIGASVKFFTIENSAPRIIQKIPTLFHLREIIGGYFCSKKLEREQKNFDLIISNKLIGWEMNYKIPNMTIAHGTYVGVSKIFKKNPIAYFLLRYFNGYYEKKAYEKTDKAIAVSESVKEELNKILKIPNKKIIVINNGVNVRKFKPIKKLKDKKKIKIAYIGRKSYGKGGDIFLKIKKELADEKELDFIEFDKIKYPDMPKAYNNSDIIIFPSRYEGNSLALLEAASCGSAIISSNTGLCKSLIKNKKFSKYIVKTEDYKDYIKVILDLIKNKKELKKCSKVWNKLRRYSLEKEIIDYKKVIAKIK